MMKGYITTIKRHMFTPEEDQLIIELHEKHGDNSWDLIKIALGLKDVRSARERFRTYLNKNNSPFTEEEDHIILDKYSIYGSKWTIISGYLKNRSDIQVRNRYRQLTTSKKLRRYRTRLMEERKLLNKNKQEQIVCKNTPISDSIVNQSDESFDCFEDLFSTFIDDDTVFA